MDLKENLSEVTNKVNFNGKFFRFLDPVLSYVDDGAFFRKPFEWLYKLIAVANLLVPIYMLYLAVDNKLYKADLKFNLAFIVVLVVIAALSWFSFMIWWNRSGKVNKSSQSNDNFVAIPVYSHLVQTFGEWLGMYVGVGGFIMPILLMLFLGDDAYYFVRVLDLPFAASFVSSLMCVIYGFLIVVCTRVLAEFIRAIADIANNTSRIH